MGSVTQIFTRQMHLCVQMRSSWSDRLFLSSELLDEVRFWIGIDVFNGYAIRKIVTCSKVICCDASDTGYGSYVMCNGNVQSVGLWNECDGKKSSTFRELKAILFALHSFCSHLRNEKVKVFSDGQNAWKSCDRNSSI